MASGATARPNVVLCRSSAAGLGAESADQIQHSKRDVNDVISGSEHQTRKLEHVIGSGSYEITYNPEQAVYEPEDDAKVTRPR